MFPYFRVAEMFRAYADIFRHSFYYRIVFPFCKCIAILTYSQTLTFNTVITAERFVQIDMSRIDCIQFAVLFNGTAGKTAVFIVFIRRRQRNRSRLPVCQITAGRMSPVHRSPFRSIRIMLIK